MPQQKGVFRHDTERKANYLSVVKTFQSKSATTEKACCFANA